MSEKFVVKSVTGQDLDCRLWLPEGEIRGIVQIVHGMAEHIDRYDRPAKALCQAGYAVCGHSHIGHGDKAVIKGHFPKVPGWQALIDDVHEVRKYVQGKYPDVPYFILGHSMGSFVTRCYLLEKDKTSGLAGAVITGTGYFGAAKVYGGLAAANLVCLFGGSKKPSPLINTLAFSASNKPFAPNRTEFDWLSRDNAEVDKYVADPNCGFLFTGSGYREMFRGLKRLLNTEKLRNIPSELPIYLFSGAMDPVGNMGKGVEKVAGQIRASGVRDVTVRLYPDGRHEMFNELNRDECLNDLIAWLNEHNKQV